MKFREIAVTVLRVHKFDPLKRLKPCKRSAEGAIANSKQKIYQS